MHICCKLSRRVTFTYSIILFLIDLFFMDTFGYEDLELRLLTYARLVWCVCYILTLYNANKRIFIYFLWILDVVRLVWWFGCIFFYVGSEDSSMSVYTLVVIICVGIFFVFLLDTEKVDGHSLSELTIVDMAGVNNFSLCDFIVFSGVREIERQDNQRWTRDELRIRSMVLSSIEYASYRGEGVDCVICLEGVSEGVEVGNLVCGHVFHRICLERWVVYNRVCPLCRIIV